MPRNVRNFWIEVWIDGRKTVMKGGPSTKGGGFALVVKQRDDGEVVTACVVTGESLPDGRLVTAVDGEAVYESRR